MNDRLYLSETVEEGEEKELLLILSGDVCAM